MTPEAQIGFAEVFGVMPSRASARAAHEQKFPTFAAFLAGADGAQGPVTLPQQPHPPRARTPAASAPRVDHPASTTHTTDRTRDDRTHLVATAHMLGGLCRAHMVRAVTKGGAPSAAPLVSPRSTRI